MTTKKGNETKIFGGQRFKLASVWRNKDAAVREANWWRSHKEYKARVTRDAKNSASHCVWIKKG